MKRFSSTWSSKSWGLLRRHCLQQAFGTDDSHDSLHVVGEHIQTHLRADAGQPTCEEMRGSHALLSVPKGCSTVRFRTRIMSGVAKTPSQVATALLRSTTSCVAGVRSGEG